MHENAATNSAVTLTLSEADIRLFDELIGNLHQTSGDQSKRPQQPIDNSFAPRSNNSVAIHCSTGDGQSRAVRNRMAAQESRNKKRKYVECLEQSNADMARRCEALERQNQELTARLDHLTALLSASRSFNLPSQYLQESSTQESAGDRTDFSRSAVPPKHGHFNTVSMIPQRWLVMKPVPLLPAVHLLQSVLAALILSVAIHWWMAIVGYERSYQFPRSLVSWERLNWKTMNIFYRRWRTGGRLAFIIAKHQQQKTPKFPP